MRGDVFDVDFPFGRRPAVVVTRDRAIPLLTQVTVVPVTRTVRGIPTEVLLNGRNGLAGESCASCDNVQTVAKARVGRRRGALGPAELRRLDNALRIALGLD
jgi:mRNA interferase MazF